MATLHTDKNGYLIERKSGERKLTKVHRRVMEEKLGRTLSINEHVHHKDGDKLNNHPDNLELMTASEHMRHHKPRGFVDCICSKCGKEFTKRLKVYNQMIRLGRPLFCSKRCACLHMVDVRKGKHGT